LQFDVKKAAEDATAVQDKRYKKVLNAKDKEFKSRMKYVVREHRREKNELLDRVDVSSLLIY